MKYRYLFINEDYEVEGTNDEELALWMTEHGPIVDVVAGRYLRSVEGYPDEIPEIAKEWREAKADEDADKEDAE